MKKINHEHLTGFICILIAIVTLILSAKLPKGRSNLNIPGPAFFPNLLGIGLLICGIYQIILGFFKKDIPVINFKELLNNIKNIQVINLFIVIGLLIFFILFYEIIGFIICLTILLVITMIRFKVRLLSIIIATIVFIGIILIIFGTLFHVSLPMGILSLF